MSIKHSGIRAVSLGVLLLCAVIAMAVRAEPQKQDGPPSSISPAPLLPMPFPPPLPPQLRAPPPAPNATLAKHGDAIGSAEMAPNGAIRLHLWPPAEPRSEQTFPAVRWAFPQERIGYGEIEIERTDAIYKLLLKHVGGLRPGEVKPVRPWHADEHWHCIVDPDRGPCPLEHLLQ